jgi:hypothetical protein
MPNPQRRAGRIFLKIDGVQHDAKGSFTYNLGQPKREAIVGADRVHGFKERPQTASIEGEVTDRNALKLEALQNLDDVTVTLELANGKIIVLRNAWYANDGNVGTEEGNIAVTFQGMSAEETKQS